MNAHAIKAITTHKQATSEAIENIRYGATHGRWLAALMTAIRDSLEKQGPAILEARVGRAVDLANLGQYLADDMTAYMEDQADALESQLNATEGKE